MAKYYRITCFDIEDTGRRPSTHTITSHLQSKNISLQTGDIVNFSENRQIYAYIYVSGTFVKNPDASGSGYLTIPLHVTQHLKHDAVGHYAKVIKKLGVEFGDIELDKEDKFIKKIIKTSSSKLDKAAFSYSPFDGQLYVSVGKQSNTFDIQAVKAVTQTDIEAHFEEKTQTKNKKKSGLLSKLKKVFTKKAK